MGKRGEHAAFFRRACEACNCSRTPVPVLALTGADERTPAKELSSPLFPPPAAPPASMAPAPPLIPPGDRLSSIPRIFLHACAGGTE